MYIESVDTHVLVSLTWMDAHPPTQVSQCYPDEMASFPDDLQNLLRKHAPVLDHDVRLTLCKG